MPTHPVHRTGLTIREMIPTRRDAPLEWKVHGHVIGWVHKEQVGRSTRPFYRATGIHQPAGETVDLELSTDRDERIETVCQFCKTRLSASSICRDICEPCTRADG